MKFDAVKLDAPIIREQAADYWREKAECLEEWVCELLRKNQVLRMGLEIKDSLAVHREEVTLTAPPLSFYELPIASDLPVFGTRFEILAVVDDGRDNWPTKQCAEIRKSVVQFVSRTSSSRQRTTDHNVNL